jgi:hypothetical protein
MLGNELFRRRYRPRAEIVVPAAGNAREMLGRPDQAIKALAERQGNDSTFSPCTTSTGAVTLLARRSERN